MPGLQIFYASVPGVLLSALRRYEYYDETGKLKGYGKENTSLKQFELYDGRGKRAGFMKRIPISTD